MIPQTRRNSMMYGIMKEKDVKLSSIVRAHKEETTPKKVEDRLSRMLSAKGLEAGLHGVIAAEGAMRRGFDPAEAEREAEAPLFEFFGLNTG